MGSRIIRRILCVGLIAGAIGTAVADAQSRPIPECAHYTQPFTDLPNGLPFDVPRAIALFRFGRQDDALRELDSARTIARGPWRWRLPPDLRDEMASALDAVRACLAANEPAPLSTLTVRVLGDRPDGSHGPMAGARVFVDDIPLGSTSREGTLTAQIPSGRVRLEAAFPVGQWRDMDLSLPPGQSELVDITLADGKEVTEPSTLALVEAVDDIVPQTSSSLTLQFLQNDRPAPVSEINRIELVDETGGFDTSLDEHFAVKDGQIVATNPQRLFKALAAWFGQTIRLAVYASASEDAWHVGTIAFRVGQSPLSVALAAPPSNPALGLSNIEVGISMPGAGIAVQRISDARGRFEIAAFPHGTASFECVAVADGKYYYGQAILEHSGPQEVTLVLRHVDDLHSGVAPLRPRPDDDTARARLIRPEAVPGKTEARILVTAEEKGRTIATNATLTLPRGTERLLLAYEVISTERRMNPRFSDVWTLSVFGDAGRRLFYTVRDVRSQHQGSPSWQYEVGKNRTGRIQEVFDVSRQAAGRDVVIAVAGTAINIGDDLDPTTVEALIAPIDRRWEPTRRSRD
jgi:hypothetical protein